MYQVVQHVNQKCSSVYNENYDMRNTGHCVNIS